MSGTRSDVVDEALRTAEQTEREDLALVRMLPNLILSNAVDEGKDDRHPHEDVEGGE